MVVLGVEDHGLLNLLNTLRLQFIVPNAELANSEVIFQGFFDGVAALLSDAAVKYLQLLNGAIVRQQLSNR